MREEILNLIKERGWLLEKKVLELLDSFKDLNSAKEFLMDIERISGEKMITMNLLNRNVEFVNSVVKKLPGDDKSLFEKTFVKMGVSLEVIKESEVIDHLDSKENLSREDYRIFYANTKPDKKVDVADFTGHFRARYQSIQRMLMNRAEVQKDLISINKISSDRQSISIIGILTEKRISKNKNLILKFEDLTGEISAVVNSNRGVFSIAEELQLDDIVAVKATGNRELLFVQDIYFPDSFKFEKVRFNEDVNIAFISDIHSGSDRFLKEGFSSFIAWLNSKDELARRIKYIFIVGDNVDGVGVFPGQERFLIQKSMVEQYNLLADFLKKVPKNITMFMCPGQHDAVRVAEPQPIISRKYASSLYEIENLVLLTNPCYVHLVERNVKQESVFKVLMYHGASLHVFVNEIKELREMKAYERPAAVVKHLLKRRHLAPSHGVSPSIVYTPNKDKDPLVIDDVPDILCTGEVHHLDIDSYNGVLIITGSCWQAKTPFEEKVGHVPDPCKVPIFNLKTGALKIFDFGIKEELERWM